MGTDVSKKIIWYFCVIGLFAIFSTSISKNPVLPLYAGSLGADETLIGIICAISPIAGIIFSFPVGVISDKLGRRKLLILSGLVIVIAPLLYLIVSDPLWLIPIRFFHGTATATLSPVISSAIADKFGKQKGLLIGTYSSSTLIGRTLAPLIGGAVITLFAFMPADFSYHAVYAVAFLAGVPVLILTLLFKDSKTASTAEKIRVSDFTKSLAAFLSKRDLRCTSAAQMITYFCFGAFETFLPVYLLANGADAWQTGIIFGVQVLVLALTKPYFGKIADNKNPVPQIILGLILTGVSLAFVSFISNIWIMLGISIIFGLGMSMTTVAANVYAADKAQKNQVGASLGALSSIMDIGHSSGPLVTGIIITVFGYTAGFGLCFVLSLIAAIYVIIGARTHG
ncbi:MAG: MFS transporter [Methanocorpusculum sp.]|nr:MFS transporter [Methanocorpusculum sp.]